MKLINEHLTEKGRKTVDALIHASKKNFYIKGYQKTTVKDITKDAGVSVGTFYLYFEDKFSLYELVLSNYSDFIKKEIRKRIPKNIDRKEAERQGLIAYIQLAKEHPDIYRVIWEALSIDRRLFFDYYDDFAKSYIRQLEKAKTAGEIDYPNAEIAAYMFIGMHTFLGFRYSSLETVEEIEEVADQFIEMLSNGFFNDKTKNNERMEIV